ncbi:membrane bound O-acyl transferase family-domain-containing protein [Schizophyllum commune]
MFDDSIPLDGHAALTLMLPAYALLYAESVLVQLSGTRLLRLALLPCGLYFMLQSAKVDQTSMFPDNYKSRLTYFNLGNITIMLTLAMQLVTFAIAPAPLYRTDRPRNKLTSTPLPFLLSNALDLMFNARGIGWNWGTSIPRPTYPTRRSHAILYSLTSFILHTLLVDAVLFIMYTLNPALRNPEGASMFLDHTEAPLSPFHTTAITLCMGTTIYAAVVYPYDAVRITALLLGDDPARWPPLFDAPWAATSLKDLWGRRWHQMFRHSFVVLGAGPGRVVGEWAARVTGIPLGRIFAVLAAFALSSLLHSLPLHGMGRGGDALRISVFFMMMGVGIVLEETWKELTQDVWRRFTGRSVRGLAGWIWTHACLLGWGHFLVEAYCQKGIAGALWFRIVTFSVYGIPEHA